MRFTKLPVTIEAVRFVGVNGGVPIFGPGPHELGWTADDDQNPEWLREALRKEGEPGYIYLSTILPGTLHIGTLEGTMNADKGDWIIRGIEGEVYPCKASIFEASYMVEQEPEERTFTGELEALINRHSVENGSNTPDWILAGFVRMALAGFEQAVNERERWYGRLDGEPGEYLHGERTMPSRSMDIGDDTAGFIGESTPLYQIDGDTLAKLEGYFGDGPKFSVEEWHQMLETLRAARADRDGRPGPDAQPVSEAAPSTSAPMPLDGV